MGENQQYQLGSPALIDMLSVLPVEEGFVWRFFITFFAGVEKII